MSKVYQDKTMQYQSSFMRKCWSQEDVSNLSFKTRAILS